MVIILASDIAFAGGPLEVVSTPQQHLTLKGTTNLTLPLNAAIEPILDEEEFRRHIVTEGINIPPPETERRIVSARPEEIPD
jgi:hypothetical protein